MSQNRGQYNIHQILGSRLNAKEEREANDFYATDPECVRDLCRREAFSEHIWEPAAGGGQIAETLREQGYDVLSTDLYYHGYSQCKPGVNFLTVDVDIDITDYDIVTNPPYKCSTMFIRRALDVLNEGSKVAMLLPVLYLSGQRRYKKIFKTDPPKRVHIYTYRINCARNGDFYTKSFKSALTYAWFVWEKGFKGVTEIDWIIKDNKG